jgi:Xaa-Pro aminopeptidase
MDVPALPPEIQSALAQWQRLRARVEEMRASLLAAERAQTIDAGRPADAAMTELAAKLATERASFDALVEQLDRRIADVLATCEALERPYVAALTDERAAEE